MIQFQLSKYFPNLPIDHTAQLFQPLPFHRDVRMLPECKSLQIHKVAADGICQQSPSCYHKIRPEPGRQPRNVPLGIASWSSSRSNSRLRLLSNTGAMVWISMVSVSNSTPKLPRWRSMLRITASRTIRWKAPRRQWMLCNLFRSIFLTI